MHIHLILRARADGRPPVNAFHDEYVYPSRNS